MNRHIGIPDVRNLEYFCIIMKQMVWREGEAGGMLCLRQRDSKCSMKAIWPMDQIIEVKIHQDII